MELKKQNLHMEKIFPVTSSQLVLDEDFIIPDSKTDVISILLEKGDVVLEDVRVMEQHITVRGKLFYSVLYKADSSTCSLCSLSGAFPFEENLFMDGIQSLDSIQTDLALEDLSVNIINSRKLNLRCLIDISARKTQIYDEELPTDFQSDSAVESHYETEELLELSVLKKDVCRIREEAELPKNYPNIQNILWSQVFPGDLEIVPEEGQLSVKCDLQVFVLYQGEGDDNPILGYDFSIPYNSKMECTGSNSAMIPFINHTISHCSLEARPDYDGEQRVLGLDMVMDMNIRLYEEKSVTLLADVYGIERDYSCETHPSGLKKLCVSNNSLYKLSGKFAHDGDAPPILQLCHSCGHIQTDEPVVCEEGLKICGALSLQILYVTGRDDAPYYSVNQAIPFCHTIEVPNISQQSEINVQSTLDKLSISLSNEGEIEVRASICFKTFVCENLTCDIISDISESPIRPEIINNLPGAVIYFVKEGDTLWNIGKRYYVPVSSIRQQNDLTGDRIYPGDRLIIVK